jgi:molecular chaperone DnaJ
MGEVARDYYEVLGVSPDADARAIKRAFRSLARELHPDVSTAADAVDRFAEISRAYSVLSTPTARLLYDRVGYRGRGNGGFESPEPSAAHLSRLFEVAEVEIDGLEAMRGTTRRVGVTTIGTCAACAGSGAATRSRVEECASCKGSGRVRRTSMVGSARFLQLDECPDCGGAGETLRNTCPACTGTGRAERARTLRLRVPAGTEDGRLVRADDGGREVYVALRVVPIQENRVLRYSAAAGVVLALVLLVAVALAPDL